MPDLNSMPGSKTSGIPSSSPKVLSGLLFLFLVVTIVFAYGVDRTSFFQLIACYGGLFLLYFGILKSTKTEKQVKLATYASIGIRLAILFALPQLSDDFYRFLWDGRLLAGGENPLAHLPSWYMDNPGLAPVGIDRELFESLNSPEYYTVYPPLLQAGFWLSGWLFPQDIHGGAVVLKSLIFLVEIGSIFFISRLARHFKLPGNSVLIYALNPLVLIELSNIHFEAVMIFFLLGGIYFIVKKYWIPSAMMLGGAIGAKIIPLMFLPFMIKRLGIKKSIPYFIVTGMVCLILFFPLLDPELSVNFARSLKLYFAKFEFNASFYYFIRGVLGGWINRTLGVIFPIIIFITVVTLAVKEEKLSWKYFAEKILFSLTIYYLLATTVHPWYLTTFVAFAALTGYRYPLIWSGMITLTYITYIVPGKYVEQNWIIALEYLLVLSVLFYEVILERQNLTLEEWVLNQPVLKNIIKKTIPGRVKIKLDRIHRHILPAERVLDVGVGNGGLALELINRSVDLTPLDVKDISFFEPVKPVIYDGNQFPFDNDQFDRVLITTVLHHTPDPEKIIDEALRVAPKLVIMEDIYSNPIQKHLTFFMDSLVNLEFQGHPHTNKTDEEWKALFKKKGLKLTATEYFNTLIFFRQVIYVLERE